MSLLSNTNLTTDGAVATGDLIEDEEAAFAEEVGSLVFQSALMRYIATESEEQAAKFEAFVDAHVAHESFMEDLCVEYPEFEEILRSEMTAFIEEAKSITAN